MVGETLDYSGHVVYTCRPDRIVADEQNVCAEGFCPVESEVELVAARSSDGRAWRKRDAYSKNTSTHPESVSIVHTTR